MTLTDLDFDELAMRHPHYIDVFAMMLGLLHVGRAAMAPYAMGDGQRARDLNLFDVGRAAGASYAPQSSCYEAQ